MGGGITDVERGLSPAPRGVDGDSARAEMVERMQRVVDSGDWQDEDPLVNLRHMIEADFQAKHPLLPGVDSRLPDGYVVEQMADSEIARIKRAAEDAVPRLPEGSPYAPGRTAQSIALRERGLEWARARADGDRSEYEAYLFEIGRLEDEERSARPRYAAGPADLYQQYVGVPLTGVVDEAERATPLLISLLLDFTPIVGQVKAVAEAIIGRGLITGRQLEWWERGLGALLAIVPEARGIFRTGRSGLRTLATLAKNSSQSAEDLFRMAKGASRMAEEDVVAARPIVDGRPVDPAAAERVADGIEEMVGNKPRGARNVSWRATAGVIEDGRGLSRSVAASPIKVGAKTAAKAIEATKTAPKILADLTRAGISVEAVAKLERAGVKITDDAAKVLIDTKAGAFINAFHGCSGFEEVVKDVTTKGTKKKGGMFVIEFVTDPANKINPANVKFELAAGITKGSRGDKAARLTDLVITDANGTVNYEFKAYQEASVAAALRNPKKLVQLVKDVAMFGRRNVRWVFDSREVSREVVYKELKTAITNNRLLAKEFGDAAKLDNALDELIVMYPPVPKAPTPPLPAPRH